MLVRTVVTALACLGALASRWARAGESRPATITVDETRHRVLVDGRVAPQGQHKKVLKGVVEYLACAPKGKTYESILICTVDPLELYAGLKKIGLRPGKPARKSGPQKAIPGQTFKDPQCGMYVASSLAVSHQVGGKEHHFCSARCRDEFLAEQAHAARPRAQSL